MAWAAVIGGTIAAGTAVYKGIKGAQQERAAEALAANRPQYQMNQGIIDNARTLSDVYGNYQIPGYGQLSTGINANYQGAFDNGVKGATSSNDILDLATKMAYGKNQAFNQLGEENAQGKQSILGQYLNANAAAGQEQVNKRADDLDQYNALLKQKAALTQAGNQNVYGALDQLATIGSKYAFSQAGGGDGTPSTADNNPATYSSNPALKANKNINNWFGSSANGSNSGIFSTSN